MWKYVHMQSIASPWSKDDSWGDLQVANQKTSKTLVTFTTGASGDGAKLTHRQLWSPPHLQQRCLQSHLSVCYPEWVWWEKEYSRRRGKVPYLCLVFMCLWRAFNALIMDEEKWHQKQNTSLWGIWHNSHVTLRTALVVRCPMKGVTVHMDKVFETTTDVGMQEEGAESCLRDVSWDWKSHQNLCFRIECDYISQTETCQAYKAVKIMAWAGWERTGVSHM